MEFIGSTFPGQLYPMYAEKIAHNKFHLSPEVPGARVEGKASQTFASFMDTVSY